MLALTTVVAITVTCAVVFMVSTVVVTIIWVKIRQERRLKSRPNAYGHNLQPHTGDTLTELSREEGSALRQYGQLPFGKPTEWGLLASRESLIQHPGDKESSIPLSEKLPQLPRLQTIQPLQTRLQPTSSGAVKHLSHLTTLTERTERSSRTFPTNEEMSISAVDGAMELPTETTPRQTPEMEDEQPKAEIAMRPISGVWPTTHRRERSGNLFPVFEDNYESFDRATYNVQKGSITFQTAGTMPEQPVPPPPCAYPLNRFRLSKNDSVRFSSLSLETADSSILNESRRTSRNMDINLASPPLPPCPTLAPFSANDVGRIEYERKSFVPASSAIPGAFIFPSSSPLYEGYGLESAHFSPRRSLTAHSPTHAAERISPPPRRSESLGSKQPREDSGPPTPYLDFNRVPPLHTVDYNAALLPNIAQMQRHSMHGSPRRGIDPFYNGPAYSYTLTHNPYSPGRRASSLYWQETHPPANIQPVQPLTSALKGGSGPRKGHKRQNCVRISIHPPMTFEGPAFSPMVEEPEENELDMRRSEISDLSASVVSHNSSISALSTNRSSLQDVQRELPYQQAMNVPDGSHAGEFRSSMHAKNQVKSEPENGNPSLEKTLPEIFTVLPTTATDEGVLSHTPSPERNPTAWIVSDCNGSPASGSPRRSTVMGPRIQPGRPARSSYQPLVSPIDESQSTGSPKPQPDVHSIQALPEKSVDSVYQAKDEAIELLRLQNQPQATQNRMQQWHRQPAPAVPNGIIVPIWENRNHRQYEARNSTALPVNSPVELHGDTSPRKTSHPKGQDQAEEMDKITRMPSFEKSRANFTTPTKKRVGLGIGAQTPGSLYDGDGFLKE